MTIRKFIASAYTALLCELGVLFFAYSGAESYGNHDSVWAIFLRLHLVIGGCLALVGIVMLAPFLWKWADEKSDD